MIYEWEVIAHDRGIFTYDLVGGEELRVTMEERMRFRNLYTTSPSDVQDSDAFAMKVVAVARDGQFWKAYQGPSDWSDERVASQGDELSPEQAVPLFLVLRDSGRQYGGL